MVCENCYDDKEFTNFYLNPNTYETDEENPNFIVNNHKTEANKINENFLQINNSKTKSKIHFAFNTNNHHKKTKYVPKFTIGYRSDCKKCRDGVPNHYGHIN